MNVDSGDSGETIDKNKTLRLKPNAAWIESRSSDMQFSNWNRFPNQ